MSDLATRDAKLVELLNEAYRKERHQKARKAQLSERV
jgi:hypothetical protein